jgi:small-conductance mechanosensitive channel
VNRRRLALLPGFAFAVSACGSGFEAFDAKTGAPGELGTGFAVRLLAEARALGTLFEARTLALLALALFAAWLTLRAVRFAIRIVWRLGFDPEQRLAFWDAALRVALVLVIVYAVGRRAASVAPFFTASAGVLLLVAWSWVLSAELQNLLVGVGLVLRRRLRGGDRVQIGAHGGIVRRVGLNQLELRQADGARLFIPNRLLYDHALTVAREKNSVAVVVELALSAVPTLAMLDQIRRVALLSPYRAPGSSVSVHRVGEDRLSVELQAWAAQAARVAAEHLEASLLALLSDEARRAESRVA